MKTLKDLLPKKRSSTSFSIDEKTLFFVTKKVLIEEYGIRGGENIIPTFFKEKKLFLSPRSSLWSSELYLMREHLCKKINEMLGNDVVKEIKITQQI